MSESETEEKKFAKGMKIVLKNYPLFQKKPPNFENDGDAERNNSLNALSCSVNQSIQYVWGKINSTF